jgi:hypothetical protein
MKNNNFNLSIFVFLSLFVIFASCGKQKTKWGGTIEEVDGVTVVTNPIEPMYGEEIFSLEEELAIGVVEGEDAYMFSRINDIDVDEEGKIYVAEGASAHIRIFDENGKYIRSIGRKGQGPGEFQMPIYVQVTSKNEIMVHDYMVQRLSFFSLDGNYLRQISTIQTRNPFIPLRMDTHGNLIVMAAFAPAPVGGKQLKMYDANLELVSMIAKEERDLRKIFDIGKPTWYCDVSPNDRIVWGDSSEYVLQILNHEGKLEKKITKGYAPVEIAEEDKKKYKDMYAGPLKMGLKIQFRNHFPAFGDISVDDEERIFVKTYERINEGEERFYFDVFDAEGKYLAKVPFRANLSRISEWKKGKLYTIEEDEDGYVCVSNLEAHPELCACCRI